MIIHLTCPVNVYEYLTLPLSQYISSTFKNFTLETLKKIFVWGEDGVRIEGRKKNIASFENVSWR